ncbi:tetratricopeptide repeat protein [Candidatus Hodarchaeum mangrovi]
MTNSFEDEINYIRKLANKGDFRQGLEKVRVLSTSKKLTGNDQLTCSLLENQFMIKLGELVEANEQIEEILKHLKETKDDLVILDFLLHKIEICWRSSSLDEGFQVSQRIEEILRRIERNFDQKNEIDSRKGEYFLKKGVLEWYKGNLDQSLIDHQKSLSFSQSLNDKQGVANVLNNLGLLYRSKGNLDKAIECHQESINIVKRLGNDQVLASNYNNLGAAYHLKGDHKKALEFLQKSLILKRQIGNQQEIALTLLNLGVNCRMQGSLNQGLEYYQQAQLIFEKLGDKKGIALVLNNLGDVYQLKGALNLALEYYQESLTLYDELGMKEEIALSYLNIGEIYKIKKNARWAEKYFLRSLKIYEESQNDLSTSNVYYNLFLLSLDNNELHQSQNYLQKVEVIKKRVKSRIVNHQYLIGKALLFKTSTRFRSKMKAIEILEKVVEEEVADYNLTITAMISLCDLLLFELKTTGEEEILIKVKELTNQLLDIAKKQSSHSLLAETYVLQSKLTLLELNITKSQKLLESALSIAEEKGLRNLAVKIFNEKIALEAQIENWEHLLKQKTSLNERLELTRLEDIMSRVAGKSFEITEEEVKQYATRAKSITKDWEEVPIRKYNLIHLNLLKDSSKTEKNNFRVAIAQIGVSETNDIVNEFYEERLDGLFSLKKDKVEVIKSKLRELVKDAHSKDVKVLLFPELSIDFNYQELLEEVTNLANKYDMYIIPGSYHNQDTKRNICLVLGPEGVLWQQEKHIPAIIHYHGRRLKEGINTEAFIRNTIVCRTEYGNIAITICRDFLDMDLRVELKNSDPPVDMIFNPAFTPVTDDFKAAHFDARRSIYAYCFFANIAEVGGSFIFTPEREKVERKIPPKKEDLIYKEVDLFRLRSERKKWEIEQGKDKPFIQSTRV